MANTAGSVDSYFSVLMRVGTAALVFLPFLRTRGQSPRTIVLYMLVGAMQLGIMYLLAFRAYLYLTVSEFLLFTVFTPLYITLIYDLLSGRKLRWGYLLSAALAVLGAAIIRYDKVSDHFWTGLLLVQLSNLCFAIGMVGYKRLMEVRPMPQHNAFAGSMSGPLSWRWRRGLCSATPRSCRPPRCSGACWCGSAWWLPGWVTLCGTMAPPVDAGTLGIMNNVHVPAGLLVNLAIWQEQPHWPSFISGALVIPASLWVHRRWVAPHSGQTADDRRRGSAQSE